MSLRAPKGFIDESDPKVCQIGHPAPPWLVNYADLMTEMVCFFVILYALSAALNKDVQDAKSRVEKMMQKGQMKGEVKIDQEGLKISLEEEGKMSFFESGSADLTPGMKEILVKLSPILMKLTGKQDIIIEGHTDNKYISNDYFDSNWELSTARATNVVRTLIDKHGFPPNKMAAMGYGEFRPQAPNDSPDNMAKNRRVVFFVKNVPFKAEEPKPEKAPPMTPKERVGRQDGPAAAGPPGEAPAADVVPEGQGAAPAGEASPEEAPPMAPEESPQ
ncbi:MAG: OmpA family protein [Elusimicrobia bacterium]|nr:OmpA family protein [Elusimicrobiota bacterium]